MPHLLNWLYTAISWVLLRWHDLFSLLLGQSSGWAWVLSIVFLVITVRLILFPLFVKQMHSMMAMQKLQPKLAAIRAKHKNDKQAQTRAMMDLQREAGVNPLGGCLPLVLQTPVFISLFHVLRHLQPGRDATLYGWSEAKFDSAVHAKILGAPLPAYLRSSGEVLHRLNADVTSTRIVIIALLLVSCAATFVTQKQSYNRNKGNLEGQQAAIQKFMLWVVPFGLLISNLIFPFPLGVLIYWVSNNVWTMGQQFYIFHRMAVREAATAEAAAVDTKALAPKPGQKPTQPKNARTRAGIQASATAVSETETSTASERSAAPAAKPAPGQKPKRRPQTSSQPAVAEASGDGGRAVSRPVTGQGGNRKPAPGQRPSGAGQRTSNQRKKKRR